ncbi:MAG: ABC transporter permease [Candidatus Omnitrophica bacterium]|nr:ABC transporter permease [Candidatus Omnitrophota bacterium]
MLNIKKGITAVGTKAVEFIQYVGALTIFLGEIGFWLFHPPFRFKQVMKQTARIGASSLPIITLISLFIGMVLALQSAYQMQKIQAEMYIASLVALSVIREIGPVLTALIVAGRCGAAITAEIGTMKVTEQIDALETLATNPINYLVVPRFWALLISLIILTIYANFIGMVGGYIVGVTKLRIPHHMYVKMTFEPLRQSDMRNGLYKSFVFAIVICVIACFEGMRAKEGAEGVGKATTSSVVRSFVLIIACDCLLTAFMYFIGR